MKKRIGEINEIPVVVGNPNEVTKNEIYCLQKGKEIKLSTRKTGGKLTPITPEGGEEIPEDEWTIYDWNETAILYSIYPSTADPTFFESINLMIFLCNATSLKMHTNTGCYTIPFGIGALYPEKTKCIPAKNATGIYVTTAHLLFSIKEEPESDNITSCVTSSTGSNQNTVEEAGVIYYNGWLPVGFNPNYSMPYTIKPVKYLFGVTTSSSIAHYANLPVTIPNSILYANRFYSPNINSINTIEFPEGFNVKCKGGLFLSNPQNSVTITYKLNSLGVTDANCKYIAKMLIALGSSKNTYTYNIYNVGEADGAWNLLKTEIIKLVNSYTIINFKN